MNTTFNRLDEVWARLPEADRLVLLGHARDDLTPADKVRLAKVAASLRRVGRTPGAGPQKPRSQSRAQSRAQSRSRKRRGSRQATTTPAATS